MEQNTTFTNHDIILHNRKQISLSGVEDCLGFDEETIHLSTKLGKLVIKGAGLHIINFDTKSGELSAEGKVNAIVYTANEESKGFFSKVFR